MPAKRLRAHVRQARLSQAGMAGLAAIDHTKIGQPNLLDPAPEMPLQRDRIATIENKPQILLLIRVPLTEVILGRCHGQRQQQQNAHHPEGRIGSRNQARHKEMNCALMDCIHPLHGQTHDHPGPRKNVPPRSARSARKETTT